jgi:hypothetical protein
MGKGFSVVSGFYLRLPEGDDVSVERRSSH